MHIGLTFTATQPLNKFSMHTLRAYMKMAYNVHLQCPQLFADQQSMRILHSLLAYSAMIKTKILQFLCALIRAVILSAAQLQCFKVHCFCCLSDTNRAAPPYIYHNSCTFHFICMFLSKVFTFLPWRMIFLTKHASLQDSKKS